MTILIIVIASCFLITWIVIGCSSPSCNYPCYPSQCSHQCPLDLYNLNNCTLIPYEYSDSYKNTLLESENEMLKNHIRLLETMSKKK